MGKVFNQGSNVLIPENGNKEGKYVKLLVDVNLTKPLILGTRIRYNGKISRISFKNEQLPYFCFYYG